MSEAELSEAFDTSILPALVAAANGSEQVIRDAVTAFLDWMGSAQQERCCEDRIAQGHSAAEAALRAGAGRAEAACVSQHHVYEVGTLVRLKAIADTFGYDDLATEIWAQVERCLTFGLLIDSRFDLAVSTVGGSLGITARVVNEWIPLRIDWASATRKWNDAQQRYDLVLPASGSGTLARLAWQADVTGDAAPQVFATFVDRPQSDVTVRANMTFEDLHTLSPVIELELEIPDPGCFWQAMFYEAREREGRGSYGEEGGQALVKFTNRRWIVDFSKRYATMRVNGAFPAPGQGASITEDTTICIVHAPADPPAPA